MDQPPAPASAPVGPLTPGAVMVANRLRKNLRRLAPWRQRTGVTCFRAYDADLPEYSAAIDVYTAEDGPWLHVQEYQAPMNIPEETTQRRFDEVLAAAADVFEVPAARIAVKTRARGKGGSKYGRMDGRGELLEVAEGPVRLLVNLFDHLDTGLFLDHRPMRRKVGELARGRRLLNLFCYTGAVTAHAVAGGAAASTSVDLSATYLTWARDNLDLNGADPDAHALVRDDVLAFLADDRDTYDPVGLRETIHHTTEERQHFQGLIDIGFSDAFRMFEQPEKSYSWWDYREFAFRRNRGLGPGRGLIEPGPA